MNIEQIITSGAEEMGIRLPASAPQAFVKYCDFLMQRSEVVNLTSIKDKADIARLHFLDSLALLKATSFKDATVLDVGSGAGFPGIPLKIAEPTIKLTLLDSSNKRISFLVDLCSTLDIEATPIQARAEEASQSAKNENTITMREQYDIVVSRALARLNALSELCLPFLRIGGIFLPMKSQDTKEEIEEAQNAITLLGGELAEVQTYKIPETQIHRSIVIISKTKKTPENYPRRFARIVKKPL